MDLFTAESYSKELFKETEKKLNTATKTFVSNGNTHSLVLRFSKAVWKFERFSNMYELNFSKSGIEMIFKTWWGKFFNQMTP